MWYLWYFTIIWIKIWLITYNSWPHQGVFEVLQIFGVKKPISWAPIDLDIQIYIIYTIMSAFCSLCQFIRIPVNLEFCQVFRCIPCVFMCSFLIDQLGNVPLISSNKEIGRAHVWTPVTCQNLVCRLLLEKKKNNHLSYTITNVLVLSTQQQHVDTADF